MSTSAPATCAAPSSASVASCWKQIGVWGDGSCAELKQATHCRNCPVYSAVGVQLLDREAPPEYLDEATVLLARPQPPKLTGLRAAVLFRIGVEWFALPVGVLAEVVERRPVHSIPHSTCKFLKGLVNIRGELQVCISLTKLLGLPKRTEEQKASHSVFERLIVVKRDGHHLVFPVSEIHGLSRYHPGELRAPPATGQRTSGCFVSAALPWHPPRDDAMTAREINVGLLDDELLFHFVNKNLA
ncbi:MAG: chemotaxis protein CheW [Verrucomicrobia bacterium]|nr:chemotaxis protein CheW [Verrucomicrobiota bacterium]